MSPWFWTRWTTGTYRIITDDMQYLSKAEQGVLLEIIEAMDNFTVRPNCLAEVERRCKAALKMELG